MNLFKDKKIISLVVVLFVFTIIYFGVVSHVSHAFSSNYNAKESYNILINTIKECSKAYVKNNTDLFKQDTIAYIKVQDLIDNDLLIANSDGNIINPLNESESLNSNIIKIKVEEEEIIVSVDS